MCHCETERARPIHSKTLQLEVYRAKGIDYVLYVLLKKLKQREFGQRAIKKKRCWEVGSSYLAPLVC